MNVFLDDVRTPDFGELGGQHTVLVRSYRNFCLIIETGAVREVSLDYDLSYSDSQHTGLQAVEWLLHYAETHPDFYIPNVYTHSQHPTGAEAIAKVAMKLQTLAQQRNQQYFCVGVASNPLCTNKGPGQPYRCPECTEIHRRWDER